MQKYVLPKIKDAGDLRGKRVLVRASLNVPVEGGEVRNTFRLTRGLGTINYLVSKGAKVILMGHIGRDPVETLLPVYRFFLQSLDITFTYEVLGSETKECISNMKNGQVVLLENLRRDPREKANDEDFAKELASLADVYVNDAFSASHREHASIVGVPRYLPSFVGLNFVHECEELNKATKPETPALFMLGGAKFDTKLPLVERFLSVYDHVFVGGALAHDFFKAKGYEIGKSIVSTIDISDSILLHHPKILLPVDVIVADEEGSRVTTPDDVEEGEMILDAGPKTIALLESYIENAKMILWNGPLGNYEVDFEEGTEAVARAVAASAAYSVVGGGDTIAAIESLDLQDKFGFLSTAGGAMLVFLEKGTLPGIEALQATLE